MRASLAAHQDRSPGKWEVPVARTAAVDSSEEGSEDFEEVVGTEAWLAADDRRAASDWEQPWASFGLSVRQPSARSWARQIVGRDSGINSKRQLSKRVLGW